MFGKTKSSWPGTLSPLPTQDSHAFPVLRPVVKGKFIFLGNQKLYIKGVTYGTFRPGQEGLPFPEPEVVARDFKMMMENGINALRTYTVPPRWLLNLAWENNLWVMVGLPWEQHITFLDDRRRVQRIEAQIRADVQSCGGHPAILGFAIGNEIPAPIVRWYGAPRVQSFLNRLYRIVKTVDPACLVTYVNYPSTEYLLTPFVDFYCFNVYLESRERLADYLARLQNLAEDKPLVMAEIGLDSQRNGEAKQAEVLEWQIRTIFDGGCGGCFIFAWTDEWYRGGFEIEDWDFGLTSRDRQPKAALQTVGQSFLAGPFSTLASFPYISVAICSYNGSATIRDTLNALQSLEYPHFETIVVDDGSTDGVGEIAKTYQGVRVITHSTNQGLSAARNTALAAARGEIIAYIDDDAYPDPHWLHYLAITFSQADWAGTGGPNLPPPEDGPIAACVANAPGGPIHVLISDREAEHIPGCNMAFWVDRLRAINGFDPRYRAAGDDVDICWRLQNQGWKIGFSPAALVWHHRRNSVKAYWKQQKGYGKAEALLEIKWPERYNALGHLSWSGRLYGRGLIRTLGVQPQRIYHGVWGSAPFQSLYEPAQGLLSAIPAMPEWYLIILLLIGLAGLDWFWTPELWVFPLLLTAIAISLSQAVWSASQARFSLGPLTRWQRLKLYGLTTLLYFMQPLARLWGRLDNGLTPWRRRRIGLLRLPLPQQRSLWSEQWCSAADWILAIVQKINQQGTIALYGDDFSAWDLEIRGGLMGSIQVLMTIEEHGAGKQLLRFRSWPKLAPLAVVTLGVLIGLTLFALWDQYIQSAIVLGTIALVLGFVVLWDWAVAMGTYLTALTSLSGSPQIKG